MTALALATFALTIATTLGDSILFPVYSEIRRDRPTSLYEPLRKGRLAMIGFVWLLTLPGSLWGQQLINLFYPGNYADAGWMLQILAVGVLIQIVSNSYDPILYAKGDTFALFGFAGIALVLGVAGGLIGAQSAGMYGLLIGTTISQWLVYLVKANYFAKRSLWQREIDLPCLGIATLLAAVIFAANSSGSSGLP